MATKRLPDKKMNNRRKIVGGRGHISGEKKGKGEPRILMFLKFPVQIFRKTPPKDRTFRNAGNNASFKDGTRQFAR